MYLQTLGAIQIIESPHCTVAKRKRRQRTLIQRFILSLMGIFGRDCLRLLLKNEPSLRRSFDIVQIPSVLIMGSQIIAHPAIAHHLCQTLERRS